MFMVLAPGLLCQSCSVWMLRIHFERSHWPFDTFFRPIQKLSRLCYLQYCSRVKEFRGNEIAEF